MSDQTRQRQAQGHGYTLRRARIVALGAARDGWVVDGFDRPTAFISDAGLDAWLATLPVTAQLRMEIAG